MPLSLQHRVDVRDTNTHLVTIETTVRTDGNLPATLTVFMPVWTPGSYLVREYARHVEDMRADAPATVAKLRKNAWTVHTRGAQAIVIRYRVYCNELTVRTNHVDDTHAFLNGAATFLGVEGHEDARARIEVVAPEGWTAATALPRAKEGANVFEAADLDALVDCPFEIGTHREECFDVLGRPHRYVIWPSAAIGDADVERLTRDTATILQTEAKIFGGVLPYDAYVFLLHLSPRGRGGLEHRTSATLLASPATFGTRDGYLDLLSLVAHEAFHLWNVKRIRPDGLTPYRYQEENYTRLLWWFEGATSYFDWRVLRLAKLCTVQEYLDHLGAEIAYLDATHGRLVHSLEEASFDAWIKLYRPDENSQNSSVSYYRKGELVCALLDVELRARTAGRVTLDHVAAHLWEHFGARQTPVPETGMAEIFERVAGVSVSDLLETWVRSATEIDYGATLAKVGLAVERTTRPEAPGCSLGARLRSDGGRTTIASVARGGAAQRAGIDPGDELVSVAGRRVESSNVDLVLQGKSAGEAVEVLLSRDGRTLTRRAVLDGAKHDRVKLVPVEQAPDSARAAFSAWLGDAHPAWERP